MESQKSNRGESPHSSPHSNRASPASSSTGVGHQNAPQVITMELSPPEELLLCYSPSETDTPDNWENGYQQYLDSPNQQGSPGTSTYFPVEANKPNENPSPSETAAVSPGRQARRDQNIEFMRKKAKDFFKKQATTNMPDTPSQTSRLDTREPVSDAVQWARLMNFDDILVNVDTLFHRPGSTFPSIDGETMRELILGQYEIARSQNSEKWLREARKWAEAFFPSN